MAKEPLWQFFRHCWTDSLRIGIDPLKRERAALVGLYRVDAAEVVGREVGARPVRAAFENEALAVGCDLRLAFDEVALAHAEKRGDAGDLRLRHADNAVLDPAARPATTAMEVILVNPTTIHPVALLAPARFKSPCHTCASILPYSAQPCLPNLRKGPFYNGFAGSVPARLCDAGISPPWGNAPEPFESLAQFAPTGANHEPLPACLAAFRRLKWRVAALA